MMTANSQKASVVINEGASKLLSRGIAAYRPEKAFSLELIIVLRGEIWLFSVSPRLRGEFNHDSDYSPI